MVVYEKQMSRIKTVKPPCIYVHDYAYVGCLGLMKTFIFKKNWKDNFV